MDSLVLNQPLEIYGQALVAICRLTSPTSEALDLLKKGWTSVVVLDQQEQPRGLFSPRCLLDWQSRGDRLESVSPALLLADVDLEPLPTITFSVTVAAFLERVTQYRHSAPMWALVDRQGKFTALLEVHQLWRSLYESERSQSPAADSLLLPLVYQLPLPVMVCDRRGEIVAMNAAWRNNLHETLPKHPALKHLANHERASAEGDEQGGTNVALLDFNQASAYQFCTTDGKALTWQVITVELQGRLQGLDLAIAYDITAQKNLAQELSGLSRVKDEFLTCINHELKTPLTSVIGIASLLSNNTFGELNDRQSRYVRMIHQSGRQLVSIIDNIFDLAKAESGQLDLYVETISVREVCQNSIQQLKRLIHQDSTIGRSYHLDEDWDLDVSLDIDPSIKTIAADEVRLQQMLVNLLSNAFKFSFSPSDLVEDIPPLSPQIGIKVRWWEGWLAITVWDQGIGIPEEKQSLVFQKFQQMENVLTRRFEGTGSSLLLTRHLARLHGGDITFVSQVDVGSQFTILLPPERPEPSPSSSNLGWLPKSQSRLVLVVETAADVVDWLRHTLSELDYQVVVARSGTEALEKARRIQPCLILLSPDMPMLSGWDVLALLKGDHLTKHIRVVIMRRADEPKVALHQADGILLKPISAMDLGKFLPSYGMPPRSLKVMYLRHDFADSTISLFQDLGHCLLEAEGWEQGEVLSKIWQPDLFVLNGDRQLLLSHLENISNLDIFLGLPILIVTQSAIAEIAWLQSRFPKLHLWECANTTIDHADSDRAAILLNLYQVIAEAVRA